MSHSIVPMIHVPDVRATVEWYESIGFRVVATYGNETPGGMSFGVVAFGDSQVMFNQGGEPSTKHRREVDLYIYADDVDDIYERVKDRVDVVERPHNTFYGMREVIIRDLNRFWISFAQESVFGLLMCGVSEGKLELVEKALEKGELDLDTLSVAMSAAASRKYDEIVELLRNAGARALPEVDVETLQRYVGKYQAENGPEVEMTLNEGRLFAAPGNQQPMSLWPLDQNTFKPIAFEGATITFNATGLTFIQNKVEMKFKKV
jgi:catechol 2,3-dioxygenase-like lactoylglutathione lyase family enzyme